MNANTTNTKRPLQVVFFCFLTISGLLLCYNLWEWYAVEKLNQIGGYNFGSDAGRAYYFQSKALYSFIHLFWGVCFGFSSFFLLLNLFIKKKWYKIVSLILAFLVFGVYIYHFMVA